MDSRVRGRSRHATGRSVHGSRPGATPVLPRMREKDLMQAIVDAARALGWLVYHTYDSRRSEPGFPDLVLVRPAGKGDPCLLFVECKVQGRKLTDAQRRWWEAISDVVQEIPGYGDVLDFHVVREENLDWFLERLKRPRRRP